MNGMWCGWKVGSSIRNSKPMRSPLAFTRLPSLMAKPASCSNWLALRSSARSCPEPSLTGGTNGSPKTSSGTLPRNVSSSFSSSRGRLALRHHVGVLEHRMSALVRPVHDGLVGPFEVEGVDQRFAQLAVLELLPPRIEEPALRAGRRVVGQHLALDPAVADSGEIVARRPDARGEFLAEQIVLAGEALEGDVAVAVKFVAQDVEIVLAARRPADRRPTSPSPDRIRYSVRPRSGRPYRGRSRAALPAWSPRTGACE